MATLKDAASRSPYIRIMLAAHSGRGVVLSARECRDLSMDDAISTVAINDGNDFGLTDPQLTQVMYGERAE